MCTIRDPTDNIMATIPHSEGLYCLAAASDMKEIDYANVASVKMTITKAHHKLGHISHTTINM